MSLRAKASWIAATRGRRAALWAVGTFLLLEAVTRRFISAPLDILRPVADPEVVFALKPGTYASDGYLTRHPEVTYTIPADGCRRWGPTAPDGRPALLALGSSLAFGVGVSVEQNFAHRVWSAMRLQGQGVNCAVPGHHLLQTLRAASDGARRERPRLIVALAHPTHVRAVFDWSRLTPSNAALRFAVQHLRLARLGYVVYLLKSTHDFRTPYESPARLRAAIARAGAAARESGARAAFFSIGEVSHPRVDLAAEFAAAGILWRRLDLPGSRDQYLDGDHWSALGHRNAADAVVAALGAEAQRAR